MKKIPLILIAGCIILAACVEQKNTQPIFSTEPPTQSFTATFAPSATPTGFPPTETPASPTITPFPSYPNKQVIFEYYEEGEHSFFDVFFSPEPCCTNTKLVLYDDGQLIFAGKSETYKQKFLSQEEIKLFLSKLDALGFYSLESNGKHDPTDKLYEYGNNYQESADGPVYCILVNADKSRNLCVYEPDMQYLIPKMKNILKYLDQFEPAGMTPYYPDRIFLSIQEETPDSDATPEAVTPWNNHFPPLKIDSTSDLTNQIMYIDGDTAKEIYQLFKNTDSSKVFSQNGNTYRVFIRVILPHEEIMNQP